MLHFVATDHFAEVVNVTLPGPNPSRPIKGTFTAKFKCHTHEEVKQLIEDLEAKRLQDNELLDRILVPGDAIEGIAGATGDPYPGEKQRELVYTQVPLRTAVTTAFFQSVGGSGGKNGHRSPGR